MDHLAQAAPPGPPQAVRNLRIHMGYTGYARLLKPQGFPGRATPLAALPHPPSGLSTGLRLTTLLQVSQAMLMALLVLASCIIMSPVPDRLFPL